MLGTFRKKRSGVLIWILMGGLIIGLAGFGIGAGQGLTSSSVARVGSEKVDADEFVRALQQELRALTGQLGREISIAEARQYGLDSMVLGRLVNDAALDGEAGRLGLSAGDDTIRDQIVDTAAFHGTGGSFDRAAYTYALEQVGLRPAQFEELIRREAGRELVAGAVQSAATLPASAVDTVLAFLGERRSFDWLRLDPAMLPAPLAAPTDAEVQAEYEANPDRYTRPETREISYASVTPAALAGAIVIPEEDLRAAYDADLVHYQTPERRVVDRIVFGTEAEAAAAKVRLDAGEIAFEALGAERGLKPEDLDQGFATAAGLSPDAREVVFGAPGPGIVGPVPTSLGPALYRINAVLGATTTAFEDARDEIARDRATAEAQRQITEDTAHLEDLIAGGATLEEMASETVLELGATTLDAETGEGIAGDPAFREAALAANVGEETDLIALGDGGLVSLRVDAVVPPALLPLEEVRARVVADRTAAQTAEALTALAGELAAELHGGLDFAALAERLGQPAQAAGPITRGEVAPGAPAELVADIFVADEDGTVVRRDGASVILAQLRGVEAFDPTTETNAPIVEQLEEQFRVQAADDVLTLYIAALREQEGVSVNQSLVESTLARFQ
jgi:peptidyl-prolyl cis-trans isomerase D